MIAMGWVYVAIVCSLTFRMMAALGAPSWELAGAIERDLVVHGLIVKGERESRGLAVAVSFRESSFVHGAIGDNGRSVCEFQIHGGSHELLEDYDACARAGLRMLRESAHVDPDNPIAFYARGPNYRTEAARRISRDRMALAHWLVEHVPEEP